MRRVSVAHATTGMILGRAVYDVRGQLVLAEGDKLNQESLNLLARSGAAEILIDDPRVADVVVGSLFSASLEAKAIQAFRVLLALHEGTTEGLASGDLLGIRPVINGMVKRLYPEVMGDPDLSGLGTLQGYDYVHPVKVTGLSLMIGRYAEMKQEELLNLGLAAMLENVGYLAMPPGIFEKAGPFTEDDWQHVRTHSTQSATMLADSGVDESVIQAVGQHHERWDGSGYPEGRKGEDISIFARIIALADTFHALLSKRPHREAFKPHEAAEFIVAYSAEFFDPKLAQIFARRVPDYPAGLAVQLSTGETGIISNPNAGHIARPIVRICFEEGEAVKEPYDLDLSEARCMNKLIVKVLL